MEPQKARPLGTDATPAPREFWTAEELAARLRVNKATIYRMARRGENRLLFHRARHAVSHGRCRRVFDALSRHLRVAATPKPWFRALTTK